MKNFLKKFVVLLSLGFVLFGFNFAFAEDAPPVAPVSIYLEVISSTDTPIYNDNISVIPCDSDNNPETPNTTTAYCAIKQLEGLEAPIKSDWSWYGTGAFVNSIAGVSSDSINNKYWTWLPNLDFSNFSLAANQYELKSDDKILFYFNTNPLKISSTSLTPEVGSEITISMTEPDYGPWPPIWVLSTGGKITIGLDVFELDVNGDHKINIINTDPIIIKGQKDGYIDSPSVTINPVVSIPKEDVCTNGATNPPSCDDNVSSGGGGGGNTTPDKTFSVSDALDFLFENKESASAFVYDWMAIAAGAGDNSDLKSSLVDYLKSNPINSSTITENERRAMALMALGINPYDGTEVDYIKKIIDSFNGTQFDDASDSDINDDIFALIVLQNSGYDEDDEIIQKTISYIIKNQSSSGSWGSVDMTAAALMALDKFDDTDGVEDAISIAEDYLLDSQNKGGFDNSASTSWAIQALSLNDLYEDEVENAIEYLTDKQEDDWGVDGADINSRIWNTSYVIPAVLGLSWNDILEDFEKVEYEEVDNGSQGGSNTNTENEEDEEPIVVALEIKTEEPIISPLEVKITPTVPVKVVKKQNEIKTEILPQLEVDNNVLSASVANFEEGDNNTSFFEAISGVLNKIKRPFVWLWIHFGF